MKKVSCNIFILLGTVFFAFSLQAQYKIQIQAPGDAKITKIYLYEYVGNFTLLVDSAAITKGKATFNSKKSHKRGFYFLGTNNQEGFNFIWGNESFQISLDPKDIKGKREITGSEENKLFGMLTQANVQMNAIDAEAKQLQAPGPLDQDKVKLRMQVLQAQYDSINQAQQTFKAQMLAQKEKYFFAKMLSIFSVAEEVGKEQFFSNPEFTDPEYTRGDMLNNKIMLFLQKYADSDPSKYEDLGKWLISKTPAKSPNRLQFVMTLGIIHVQATQEFPVYAEKVLKEEFGEMRLVKDFLAGMPKSEPREGEEAPNISGLASDGSVLELKSLRGKYVLLDFWASWCGPCRMENPNVVKLYQYFKDKGFTIYSVSLDNNKANWLGAIAKDGLEWPHHVSDLKGWQSEYAAQYKVRGIPMTFLLDKNGKIIAKNLRGPALAQKLQELMP